MKNSILNVALIASISIASIAIAAGPRGITTRNAENGSFKIERGDKVSIKGCNSDSGSSGCTQGTAAGGDVAKKICKMAEELGLNGNDPVDLATPCGHNPQGPITLRDCCGTTTGPGGGYGPLPVAQNKCILTDAEIEELRKKGKCGDHKTGMVYQPTGLDGSLAD